MITGIYKIIDKRSGRIYFGSSVDVEKRIIQHKRALINNKHHNIYLQRIVNKYGIDCLIFELVEECEKDKLF